jgi:PKD repeat protein
MGTKVPRSGGSALGSALMGAVGLLTFSTVMVSILGPAAGAAATTPSTSRSGATTESVTACGPVSQASRRGRLLGLVIPQDERGGSCTGAAPNTATTTTTSSAALTPNLHTSSTVGTTAPPAGSTGATPVSKTAKGYSGLPPMIYHGGPIMGTATTPGDVTVTPVYWDPSNTMSGSYESVIDGYIANVAADDGKTTNVYSADVQYGASYDIHAGAPRVATDAISDGCSPDSGPVYSDNSGYTACVTDAQIQNELNKVLSTDGLSGGLSNSYAVFLPKGVESCADSRNNAENGVCTVSTQGGTFCAYHSNTGGGAIYSDIPFPIYNSLTGFTCGSDGVFGSDQAPNGQPDADVVISPLSHELNEAITDPLGNAWFDRGHNEVGDNCLDFFGATSGTEGALYNQTINGAHYLTQEIFSNEDYHVSKKTACIQHADLPLASFKVGPRSPRAGHAVHFNAAKSKGSIAGFAWTFGDNSSAGSGKRTSHTYTAPGTYDVTMTVSDTDGLRTSTSLFVAVR